MQKYTLHNKGELIILFEDLASKKEDIKDLHMNYSNKFDNYYIQFVYDYEVIKNVLTDEAVSFFLPFISDKISKTPKRGKSNAIWNEKLLKTFEGSLRISKIDYLLSI